jgi:hypothetical protein
MSRAILLALSLAFAADVHGATVAEDKGAEKDACEFLSRLGGVRALDNRTAVVFSSMGKPAYVVTLSMPLPDLKYAVQYAYIDRDRDGRLCGRSMDAIALPNDALRVPARISAMTPLDADKIRALEEKYQVKLTSKKKQKAEGAPASEGSDAAG